jgi:hypothetical protein
MSRTRAVDTRSQAVSPEFRLEPLERLADEAGCAVAIVEKFPFKISNFFSIASNLACKKAVVAITCNDQEDLQVQGSSEAGGNEQRKTSLENETRIVK